MFDELIINHCAPALSGLKIANIFTYQYNSEEDIKKNIVLYNKLLNNRGINIAVIKYYDFRVIVYVYNRYRLENYIFRNDIFNFLKNYGYTSKNLYKSIDILKKRMQYYTVFPHEIGIFLGYPLLDIYGFINNYGKNSLYAGYWKVYHNKNDAVKTFNNYNKCRDFFMNTFLKGKGILEIIDDYQHYI